MTPSGAECVPTSCAADFPDASIPLEGGSDGATMDAGQTDAEPGDAGVGDAPSTGDGPVGD
jgi:hypothetical protein